MAINARPSFRKSVLTRTSGARRATLAVLLAAAPLLVGCDSSITTFFRQSAQTEVQGVITTVVDNLFGGVQDILNDQVQTTGTAATTGTESTSASHAP